MIEQLSKLRKSLLFIAAVLLASLHMTATNRDSLALTPPMGFMTWNKYKVGHQRTAYPTKLLIRWRLMAMLKLDINTSSSMTHGKEGATNAITLSLTLRSSQAE